MPSTPGGAHAHDDDPRNRDVSVYVNGELVHRDRATVSIFDAGFVFGDGVWEGLRVHDGHPAFLDQHLDRLYAGARTLMLDIGRTREELTAAIYRTLEANGMRDGVHLRLMVTRGPKPTLYQDPRLAPGPATLVIVPEFKDPTPAVADRGITLHTVHLRRSGPDMLDPKLNVHSKLPDILAGLQAYAANADEALMLDPHGFVATCNSVHFFVVRQGEVWTSSGDYCLGGITRGNILRVCREAGIPAHEGNFSLSDVYAAQEAFVTGTFGGVVPVREVDGRAFPAERPITLLVRELYSALVRRDVAERSRQWRTEEGRES